MFRQAGKQLAVWMAVFALTTAGTTSADTSAPDEYEVRVAVLLNIARFVTWPDSKAASAGKPLIIGVYAPMPVVRQFETALADKKVGSNTCQVRVLRSILCTECHVVFTAGIDGPPNPHDAAALAKAAVLTVGDTPSFAAQGGVIGLTTQDKRVRIEVNLKAAQRSRLGISSRILKLATVVGEGV